MKTGLTALVLVLAAAPAIAQHAHSPGGSPYAGLERRAVKALSEEQTADLRAGRGMTLALAAELNGYPGPSHTLEFADALGLSEVQRQRTQALFAQMQAEAKRAGEVVIAAEAALDRLFRDGGASDASMQAATTEAARAQGALRAVHLRYHLVMREVLSSAQVARYNTLRGYD